MYHTTYITTVVIRNIQILYYKTQCTKQGNVTGSYVRIINFTRDIEIGKYYTTRIIVDR